MAFGLQSRFQSRRPGTPQCQRKTTARMMFLRKRNEGSDNKQERETLTFSLSCLYDTKENFLTAEFVLFDPAGRLA
jgi:hypothetical protein